MTETDRADAPLPDDPLPEACTLLLDALRAKTETVETLRRALDDARARRLDLMAALAPLIRGLEPEARREAERRFAAILALVPRKGRASGVEGRARAALKWLCENEFTEIRAAELMHYLRRAGWTVDARYGARLLGQWAEKGIVFRTGHGLYRVNPVHDDVFRFRLAAVKT